MHYYEYEGYFSYYFPYIPICWSRYVFKCILNTFLALKWQSQRFSFK